MTTSKNLLLLACAVLFAGSVVTTSASTFTVVGANRTASLTNAIDGDMGSGNPNAADIAAELGLSSWVSRGNIAGASGTSAGGSDDLFTVTLTSGSWGGGDAAGTWAISSSFWATYGNAAISMHLGNGGGNPEHFSFLVDPNPATRLSGTWSYDLVTGTGGGLSNLRLWGTGAPRNDTPGVPDGGVTVAMLGLALAAVGLARRFSR